MNRTIIEQSLGNLSERANRYPVQKYNLERLIAFLNMFEVKILNHTFLHSVIGTHKGIALTFSSDTEEEEAKQLEFIFDKDNVLPTIWLSDNDPEAEEVKINLSSPELYFTSNLIEKIRNNLETTINEHVNKNEIFSQLINTLDSVQPHMNGFDSVDEQYLNLPNDVKILA